jgi:hypothetical protein
MLQSMAAGAGRDPATVASYVELGVVLGVTRQTLHAWKKRKDAPKPASNGLHEVAAWREFMRRHDLKGGEQPAGDADMESALKARKLLAEVEERELRLGIRRGDYVAVADVRQKWTELVAQAAASATGLRSAPPPSTQSPSAPSSQSPNAPLDQSA